MRLTGTFACRSIPAAVTYYVGREAGDTIDVSGDVDPQDGAPRVTDDRYRYDVKRYWDIRMNFGSSSEFDGKGPPWTGKRWEVLGHGPQGSDEHMTMELVEGFDFRRTFAYRDPSGALVPYRVDLCDRGDVPPPATACIASEFPSTILERADPDRSKLPSGATGAVSVAVSLDAAGTITGTQIAHSDNPRLNALALDAAQRSKYAPAIHDCKPAPSTRRYDVYVSP